MNNIIEIGGLAATAINIIQSQNIHEHETSHAKKRHDESMELAQMQHEKDLKIAKQTYLMAAFTSLEQHFQQLNADLISSSKESESDMFDQRNQSFQTVILSASVMFSSLSTVIIQGFLPANADEFLFVSYALTSALSFAFLFLSIVLCIEVILRASSFMYNRARKHTTQLREAIQKTKMMMKRIRGGQFPDENYGDEDDGEVEKNDSGELRSQNRRENYSVNTQRVDRNKKQKKSEQHYNGGERTIRHNEENKNAETKKKNCRRQIAEMKEEDLQLEWERHEAEVHKYLEEREKINDQTSVLVSADANSSRMSFEQFWRESCKFWADIAILFFYAGTANLLLAIMIYMWAEFFITYQSPIGAIIAVVFIGVSLVLGILLAIYLRQNDTYGKGSETGRQNHNDDVIDDPSDEEGEGEGEGDESGAASREADNGDCSSTEDKGTYYQSTTVPSFRDVNRTQSPNRSTHVALVRSSSEGQQRGNGVDLNTDLSNSFWNTDRFSKSERNLGSGSSGVNQGPDRGCISPTPSPRSPTMKVTQTISKTPSQSPPLPISKRSESASRSLRIESYHPSPGKAAGYFY